MNIFLGAFVLKLELWKKIRFSQKLQLKNAKCLWGIFIPTMIFGKGEWVKED